MSDTKGWPLAAADYWYDESFTVYVALLSDDLVAFPDDAGTYDDIFTYEIPDQGGYFAAAMSMGTVTATTNVTAGVVEFDVGSATWQSDIAVTVTGFRWIVFWTSSVGAGPILAVYDCATAQSLTASKLIVTVPESSVSSGVHPILRFSRNLT